MATERIVKIGVIGLGYWGEKLLRNFADLPNCQVVSAFDVSNNDYLKLRAQYPNTAFTSNFNEALQISDAVVVATPVLTHHRLAKSALQLGKHVLVEKPLAVRSEEAQELINLAGNQRKTLMVDSTYLYHPAIIAIRKVLEKARIGKPIYAKTQRENYGLHPSDLNVIWDLGPHDVAILNYVLGETPIEVSSSGALEKKIGQEDVAHLTLYYSSLVAWVELSKLANSKARKVEIVGDKGSLVFDETLESQLKIHHRERVIVSDHWWRYDSGSTETPFVSKAQPLMEVCRAFVQSVQSGEQPLSDGLLGLDVVKVLEAADESLKKGGERVKIYPYR